MRISGTGISGGYIDVQIKEDFRPITIFSLKWKQTADGNFFPVDRGSDNDVYEAQVNFYGTETEMNDIIEAIWDNRTADSHIVDLSQFNSTEHIFGANVDYTQSPFYATVLNVSRKRQGTWKGFGLSARFRALSPTFAGTASLPVSNLEIGFDGDTDRTINKIDTYTGGFVYIDHEKDTGLFKGTFIFSDADMIKARNYIRTQRGGSFSPSSIGGVTELFGPRRSAYPDVRIIDWEDLGMQTINWWRLNLTFAEEH